MFRKLLFRRGIQVLAISLLVSGPAVSQNQPPAAGVPEPSLGINFVPTRFAMALSDGSKTPELAAGAVVVDFPFPNGPAMGAGITNSEVLIALDGHRVCDQAQVPELLKKFSPGQEIELILFREGRFRTVKVRLANSLEISPASATVNTIVPEINTAISKNDYKAARELCKRIPEDLQIESTLACVSAYKERFDYKALRRAAQALSMRCRDCFLASYARSWELMPSTSIGIQANAGVIKMMSQYRQAEQSFFDKMDRDFAGSLKGLDVASATAKLNQFARIEGSCRDVPPSANFIETIVQFARQNNLPVSEEAHTKAGEAQRMESRASSAGMLLVAYRLWNSALWMAPWWNEPYLKTSALLDKLGRPQQAADIAKLAIMVPTAPVETASAPTAVVPKDNEPPSQQALLKCLGALEATEKGSEAEIRTRNRCATIAGKLEIKPAISDDARRHVARGEAAFELAQSPSDYQDASREFEAALREAPWWAEAHCDLGEVFEKAAKYQYAMYAYQGCVAAAPNTPNAQEIQKKIYKMEFAADREQKQAINTQMQQREAALRLQSLPGAWVSKETGDHYSGVIKDGLFVATRTPPHVRGQQYQGDFVIKGTVTGEKIEGTFTTPPLYTSVDGCTQPVSEMPLSGTISSDGKSMTLKYQVTNFKTGGIKATLFTEAKCTSLINVGTQTVLMILQKRD